MLGVLDVIIATDCLEAVVSRDIARAMTDGWMNGLIDE
jgi:hypothetical protein